jgi:hypothetical protein
MTSYSLVRRNNRLNGTYCLNIQGSGVLYPEKGGTRSLRNVGIYVRNYAAVQPRTHNHEARWLWINASSFYGPTGLEGPWPPSRLVHSYLLFASWLRLFTNRFLKSFSARSSRLRMRPPAFLLVSCLFQMFFSEKSKAIHVTGRGGLCGCETLRFPHFLDNRLTDGGEVVSATRLSPFTPQENSWCLFLLETESTPGA